MYLRLHVDRIRLSETYQYTGATSARDLTADLKCKMNDGRVKECVCNSFEMRGLLDPASWKEEREKGDEKVL